MNNNEKKRLFSKQDSAAYVKRVDLFGENRFWRIDGSNTAAYLLPIRLTMIYLIASVLIYAFGPFEWVTYTPVLFYALLVLYMIALWLGYRVGLMRHFSHAIEWKDVYTDKAMTLLSVLVVMNFAVYAVNIFRDYGLATFDFPELLKQMAIGIKNPGLGYNLRLERLEIFQGTDVIGGTAFSLFNYLWAFVRYPILIFSMLYFGRMRFYGKIFTVINLIVTVLFYLSIGTNIDFFQVFLLLELAPILSAFSSWHKGDLTKKKVLKLLACIMAGLVLVGCYFTWMMVSRGGVNSYDQPDYNISGIPLGDNVLGTPPETLDSTDSTSSSEQLSKPSHTGTRVPPIVMKFWVSFASYFTQGYYGMSQGMTLPWTPMFGVGNSMFLVDFISEHIYDIDQFTYQVKIEDAYGWESDMRWHSMYTWLANDVSFYGVILVMFLIGILFAMMFKDAITTNNPFARASVFYFILLALFIPCNNQLAQRADTMLSFLLLVACWLLTKHPPKFVKKILK